jgi:hypothetical protein
LYSATSYDETGHALVFVRKEGKLNVAQFETAAFDCWFIWKEGDSNTSIELSQRTLILKLLVVMD